MLKNTPHVPQVMITLYLICIHCLHLFLKCSNNVLSYHSLSQPERSKFSNPLKISNISIISVFKNLVSRVVRSKILKILRILLQPNNHHCSPPPFPAYILCLPCSEVSKIHHLYWSVFCFKLRTNLYKIVIPLLALSHSLRMSTFNFTPCLLHPGIHYSYTVMPYKKTLSFRHTAIEVHYYNFYIVKVED